MQFEHLPFLQILKSENCQPGRLGRRHLQQAGLPNPCSKSGPNPFQLDECFEQPVQLNAPNINDYGVFLCAPVRRDGNPRTQASTEMRKRNLCEWISDPRNFERPSTGISRGPRSGAEGNRTPDLNSAIVALYQLSYSPVAAKCTVGVGQRRRTSERTGSSSR